MPDHQQQTLSVPSLLLLAAFAALTIRYFFFAKPSAPSSSSLRTNNPRAANPADVEQIASMFPQMDRREIMWDLQRNGGRVNATTVWFLGWGSLDAVGVFFFFFFFEIAWLLFIYCPFPMGHAWGRSFNLLKVESTC